eukprot:15422360-Alexandrium_andersonii.AAC.1
MASGRAERMASGRAERVASPDRAPAAPLCPAPSSSAPAPAAWASPSAKPVGKVLDVDWGSRFGAEVMANVFTWDYTALPPGHFDVVWASPSCALYFKARTRARTPRDLEGEDALVARCLEITQYLAPHLWFLENPDSGLLKTRA